jgi:hypothetical protein
MRWLLKRWWFWAGTALMLVAVVAGCLLIPPGESRITKAICDRIQPGMSVEQVRDVIGVGHAGIYGGPCIQNLQDNTIEMTYVDEDGNAVIITFVSLGIDWTNMISKDFVPTELSLLEQMKRRIERRIRALWP